MSNTMTRPRRALVPGIAIAAALLGCDGERGGAAVDAGQLVDGSAGQPDRAPAADVLDGGLTRCSRVRARASTQGLPVVTSLRAPAQVLRDEQGIPHVYARSDEDAFFASGYAQAVDRIFQMELARRSAQGTLSEIAGPDKLSQDQLVRMLDIPRWGRAAVDRMRTQSPELLRLIAAWVGGVNRRVDELRRGASSLPAGFRRSEFDFQPAPWTLDDTLSISVLILFSNANQLESDILASILRRYVPAAADLPVVQPLNDAAVLPPGDRPGAMRQSAEWPEGVPWPFPRDARERLAAFAERMAPFRGGGSNNWAVAGRFAANGRPLLAGDPHRSLQSPGVMWAQHMNSAAGGGTLDVIGFSFVGTPLVQLGHNRSIAWTATTTYPDTMDIWEVDAGADSVRVAGRTVPLERCVETIAVRGREPVEYVVEEVPDRGVLLPANFTPVPVASGGRRLLFQWAGFGASGDADGFLGLNRARDIGEFERAVDRMEAAAFNFLGATRGDVSYRVRVRVPDRGLPRDFASPPWMVLDGEDPRTAWSGRWLPAERLPAVRNPARGYIASANNDPFGFLHNGVADDPWYYGAWFDPGTRARRIESELERLTRAGRLGAAEMQSLQLDTHNVFADELLPVLFAAVDRVGQDPALASFNDPRLRALRDQLRAWDRRMDRGSSPAVVFEAWQHFYARGVLADDLSLLFDSVFAASPVYMLKLLAMTANRRFPAADRYMQEGRDVLAMRALVATRDWLVERFGGVEAERFRWDRFHRTRITASFTPPGPFDTEPAATAGSDGTVNVSDAQFFDRSSPRMFHESRSGPVYRMVVTFDDDGTPSATVNFPRGNSGDPTSPFFGNTQADWLEGTYRPMVFRRPAVDAAMREQTTLQP